MGPAAAIQAGASFIGGLGNFLAARSQAKQLKRAARDERVSGLADRNRLREEVRSAIGEQLAAQVSNGLEGGSGTALDALRQSQIEGALDALELRRQSEMRAAAMRAEAKNAKRAGTFALLQGVMGAASSAYQGQSDWAQERRRNG